MTPDLQASPASVLEERINDQVLNSQKNKYTRSKLVELCIIAVPAVLNAAAGGNVTCKIAAKKLLALLK